MSAKTMKGKQAILRYLETHRTFTAKDVATECGITINCITKNAIDLERARKIVRVSKVWRTVTYRLATPESRPEPRATAPTEYFRSAGKARR